MLDESETHAERIPSDSTSTLAQFQTDLRILKAEVDSLQIHVLSAAKPWYLQISTLVSVIALAFSFGTTYVSHQHTAQQDQQAARAALRALLQRVTALPKENFELFEKYQGKPTAASQLSSMINGENTILATQAIELVNELGDRVSSSELFAASNAAGQAGMFQDAARLLELADARAKNFSDAVAALRVRAAQAYNLHDLSTGQRLFNDALSVFSRFPVGNRDLEEFTHFYTENFWAQAEMNAGRCQEAALHIQAAAEYTKNLMEPIKGQVTAILNETRTAVSQRCPPG